MNWKLQRRLNKFGPAGLFAGTALALAALISSPSSPQGSTLGFAEVESISIAPLQAGLLAEVLVKPGQWVNPGDVLATLDTTLIDEELRILEAERALLEKERSAELHGSERQQLLDRQRLEQEVEALSLRLKEEEQALTTLQAELTAVQAAESQLQDQVDQQLSTREELTAMSLRRQSLALEIAERPALIQLLQGQLSSANFRLLQLRGLKAGTALEPIDGRVEVLERRVAFLKKRRAGHFLVAPKRGQVGRIHHQVGEVLSAGQGVMALEMAESGQVLACLNEVTGLKVAVGDRAALWAKAGDVGVLEGEVLSVSPKVDILPATCQLTAELAARGRLALVALDAGEKVVPGQSFQLRFSKPGEAPAGTAKAATRPEADGEAQLMGVPDTLAQRTRIEPSAIAWSPTLSRYVVVSDDTGFKSENEHAPWLLTLSEGGQLAEQPMVVDGIVGFNDLEAMSDDGEGGFYLLSSQSRSRKGKRSKLRTQFIHVDMDENGPKVTQSRSFLSFLKGLKAEKQAELGLDAEMNDLDIEGLARFGDSLYIGLKAPLTADNQAIIWKLDRPQAFLSGQGQAEDLQLWQTVSVPAQVDGKVVPGGISSLEFTPSGGLWIASTPSTIDEGVPTGRVWFTPDPQTLEPQTKAEFVGLKPEGLSLHASGDGIVVVFDGGDAPPKWVSLP